MVVIVFFLSIVFLFTFSKPESALFVSSMCFLLPEDLHSELIFS